MTKRVFDIVVALLLIVLLAWMYVIVYVVLKCTMKGPVIFKQRRNGKDGFVFYIYKFRTMHDNREADFLQAIDDDPRCTVFGKFLRHTRVDEIPQFFNVLIGDMSLVGPRPHMVAETDYYSALIPNYKERLKIKPGITGWAQVNGCFGATPELWMMQKRVDCDVWYIKNHNIWLDIKIIGKEFNLFFQRLSNKI